MIGWFFRLYHFTFLNLQTFYNKRGEIPRRVKIKNRKLHNLRPAKGAVHKEKRIGRGEASGKGGTSTKGNKGQQGRAGYQRKMAHEGGQMPIQRRVPKRGFKNINRIEYKVFNLGQIEQLVEKYGIQEYKY